jgi:gliding motility-associated-like protein
VLNENGCSGTDTVELIVRPNPVIDLGDDRQVCASDGEELSSGDYANYQWSTGDIARSIRVFSDDGSISLTVTDWNNCSATDEITILPCDITSVIEIPGIISPNGDGVDDTWIIPDIDLYPDAHIQVFDMYGRRIFMVNGDYANTWDGTYSGKQLPVGRYFYIIDFKSADIHPLTGALTIIR